MTSHPNRKRHADPLTAHYGRRVDIGAAHPDEYRWPIVHTAYDAAYRQIGATCETLAEAMTRPGVHEIEADDRTPSHKLPGIGWVAKGITSYDASGVEID